MPKSRHQNPTAELYGAKGLSSSLPRSEFPGEGRDPRHAYAAIRDELMLDGNARQNLATFCQTWEEPELHRLMDDCIDKNMVDNRLVRSRDAGRAGDETALGGTAESGGQTHCKAQYRHRPGTDLLAQIHPLLGYRAS